MSQFDINKLADKFPEEDLEWRVQQSGMNKDGPWALVICYVDARAIMDRLDAVCGPENWQVKYSEAKGGTFCDLQIRIGDQWISKMDGSDETDIEAFKGGISKALVRAGVPWGIGRYLYNLKSTFAQFSEVTKKTPGARMAKFVNDKKVATYHYWLPPKLPASAIQPAAKEQRKEDAKTRGAAATAAVANAPRSLKQVQAEIASLCKRQQIKPGELNTMCADRYQVSNSSNLDLAQLEDLLAHLGG